MALTAAGLLEPARAAFDWCRNHQRADGSWPIQLRNGVIEDANSDSNFCAYIATGVWHHVLVTGDRRFAKEMWPVVSQAVDFVIDMQRPSGEIVWARSDSGLEPDALLTGCASIYHSLRCALALADYFDEPQPEWEVAVGQLGHAIAHHPDSFVPRTEVDGVVLPGARRRAARRRRTARIDERWDDFVVPGLGIRCVDDRPWVTGAETCELVMALDAIGETARAREQFASMHHLREQDGSYWTGLVFADGKRWPVERTTWTGGAMILAADALSRPQPPTASSAASTCRAASRASSTASARHPAADDPFGTAHGCTRGGGLASDLHVSPPEGIPRTARTHPRASMQRVTWLRSLQS